MSLYIVFMVIIFVIKSQKTKKTTEIRLNNKNLLDNRPYYGLLYYLSGLYMVYNSLCNFGFMATTAFMPP